MKYRVKEENDELNDLGKSMNLMSMQLEKQLENCKTTNLELEKILNKKNLK